MATVTVHIPSYGQAASEHLILSFQCALYPGYPDCGAGWGILGSEAVPLATSGSED